MIKTTLKIARYCLLVIQGFSNFLGLFQVIMAHPVIFLEAMLKKICPVGGTESSQDFYL